MFQIASFKIICTDSTEILFAQIPLKYKTRVCWFELLLTKTKFFLLTLTVRGGGGGGGDLISIAY